MSNRLSNKPAEAIMLSTPIGLNSLGAEFVVEAPFSACRLCGAVYQSAHDRLCLVLREQGRLVEHYDSFHNKSFFYGHPKDVGTLQEANERRERWRKLHERRYHSDEEIAKHLATGFAFTPKAANRLAPFGITPLGNMHDEIVDALFEAPRAPVNDAES